MKIVLIKDVPNLGRLGQTKEVNPGYARNFLLPQGLAVLPGDRKVEEIRLQKSVRQQEEKATIKELENLAKSIDGQTYVFTAKTDDKGHLYGSIGPKEIAAKIGVSQDLINEHLPAGRQGFKTIGIHPLEINLNGRLVKVQIVVEKEK